MRGNRLLTFSSKEAVKMVQLWFISLTVVPWSPKNVRKNFWISGQEHR